MTPKEKAKFERAARLNRYQAAIWELIEDQPIRTKAAAREWAEAMANVTARMLQKIAEGNA